MVVPGFDSWAENKSSHWRVNSQTWMKLWKEGHPVQNLGQIRICVLDSRMWWPWVGEAHPYALCIISATVCGFPHTIQTCSCYFLSFQTTSSSVLFISFISVKPHVPYSTSLMFVSYAAQHYGLNQTSNLLHWLPFIKASQKASLFIERKDIILDWQKQLKSDSENLPQYDCCAFSWIRLPFFW